VEDQAGIAHPGDDDGANRREEGVLMDEPLTEGQDAQLSEVLKVLSKLQTPVLIFESARLRLPNPPWSP
jgi:hypothetical protein